MASVASISAIFAFAGIALLDLSRASIGGRYPARTVAGLGAAQHRTLARAAKYDGMYPDLSDSELAVLAMDSTWAAVYNPAGMLAHPHQKQDVKSRTTEKTLVSRLASTFGREGHLVQRLDRPVSGISLVAFDPKTCTLMHNALSQKGARKTYYALCFGNGDEHRGRGPFLIDQPLRDKSNKNESLQHQMKDALTEVEVLWGSQRPDCCLVRAQPQTGRFHQIRRHLQSISLPILGDDYNSHLVQADWEACGLKLPPDRVFLHLHRIFLPATKVTPPIDVMCPLPPDFAMLVQHAFPSWADEAEAALPELFGPPPPNLRYQRPR